jgi:hypothetical protein
LIGSDPRRLIMSSFTDDLLVKVLAEERNGQGLFEVAQPFTFDLGFLGSGETIVVPAGFQTDFASIPGFARWLFPISGKVGKAALLHDYMLFAKDRRASDAFAQALQVAGVGPIRRWLMVAAVRLWNAD